MSARVQVVALIKAKTIVPASVASNDAEAEDVINELADDILTAVMGERPMQPGDWVEPHSRDLDMREVAMISADSVWLFLLTETPSGPFPRDNYSVIIRREDLT